MRTLSYLVLLCGHGFFTYALPQPETSTLINGQWVYLQATAGGPAEGQHTFATTQASPPSQTGSSVVGADDTCPILQQKSNVNGKAIWSDIDTTDSQAMCVQYCKLYYDPNKISSSICIKTDDIWSTQQGQTKPGTCRSSSACLA